MPRKMAGSAIRTIDASMVAISMPSVVMNRAIHLCRSLAATGPLITSVIPALPSPLFSGSRARRPDGERVLPLC